MELLENLNWRYAVKRMTGKKVPQQKVDAILEAARLSASSAGLQPYKIIVVEDEAVKKQLQPAAYNQPQITEASHLLVFAAYEKITAQDIDDFINLQATVKNVAAESLAPFKERLVNTILPRSEAENFNWAARQSYIALGTALIAAANEAVDATPMEGFDPAAFDEILGLKALGLKSVALLVLGYRDEANDFLAKAPKVRRDMKDFVVNFPAI
ncbi:NAD(P)H-dependent oxidoreductase [Ferruginibacter sp. SUN106]|uniref:NAD(P)H-dependent oxidoreductase n=1 Tax=Ferruginibacter sp. SUN106 TaxID=2978348 RepID=UPI003D36AAEB